tara:strand:- start:355 stop:555 length:201 start_codon:yes stop_codon:yes gene_type:complete
MDKIIKFINVWLVFIICFSVLALIFSLATRVPTSEKGESSIPKIFVKITKGICCWHVAKTLKTRHD